MSVNTSASIGPDPGAGIGTASAPVPPANPAVSGRTATPAGLDPGTLRLALTVGGLVLALIAGFGLGRLPIDVAGTSGGTGGVVTGGYPDHTHAPGTGPHEHGADGSVLGGGVGIGGLSRSESGYHLVPEQAVLPAGADREFRFQIRDLDGAPVTRYAVVHEKPMHLIVLRRDLTGYQHLHPEMGADGTWRTTLDLSDPGIWRVFADFSALGEEGTPIAATLGVDLVVAGDYTPRPLPAAERRAEVDGFTVTFGGTPRVGAAQALQFRIFADGAVAEVERYLGAYGHLVAVREGDLGYLHVHPEERIVDGAVQFWLSVPSPGDYRLFLDFQVGGVVRTAEFTVTVD
jgi:hypothetical protein